jgi:hypothetical protein
VQLLQMLVGDASHPRLKTLFVLPSPKIQARSGLTIPSQSIDDTFAVRDNDSGELIMIYIPSAVDAFRENTQPSQLHHFYEAEATRTGHMKGESTCRREQHHNW